MEFVVVVVPNLEYSNVVVDGPVVVVELMLVPRRPVDPPNSYSQANSLDSSSKVESVRDLLHSYPIAKKHIQCFEGLNVVVVVVEWIVGGVWMHDANALNGQ